VADSTAAAPMAATSMRSRTPDKALGTPPGISPSASSTWANAISTSTMARTQAWSLVTAVMSGVVSMGRKSSSDGKELVALQVDVELGRFGGSGNIEAGHEPIEQAAGQDRDPHRAVRKNSEPVRARPVG